jgi:hypothetical protein
VSGIPTTYRGVQMRSRHEARWAAFFDALKWPWVYEPIDLSNYIPDFIMSFGPGDLLVEVKPREEDIALAKSKIECSGWTKEAIIVVDAESPLIGSMLWWDQGEPCWGDAELFFCLSCGTSSVLSSDGSWHCRLCGADGGNGHVGVFEQQEAWVEAGNRVQWRRPA